MYKRQVLSREIHPEEMASLPVVLTQMHNFIKSNNAQPIGPIVQAMVVGEDRQMHQMCIRDRCCTC